MMKFDVIIIILSLVLVSPLLFAERLIFEDNFSDPTFTYNHWAQMYGIWSVKKGRYCGKVKNLLNNGGFEEGRYEDADEWDNYPISYEYEGPEIGLERRQYRDKEKVHTGKYSLKFDYNVDPGREGHHMHTYMEVKLPPYSRQAYVGSAWVNIPKTIVRDSLQQTRSPWGAYIVAHFNSYDPSIRMFGKGRRSSQQISRTRGWKKMEFEWEILSQGDYYARFYIYAGGMGVFWVDDVFLGLARYNIAVTGKSYWQDYILEATVNLNQESGSNKCAGIIFRYLNCDNYYLLTLEEKYDRLKLWENLMGSLHLITSGSVTLDVHRDYKIRIRCQGEKIRVSLDEKEILSASSNTFPSGKIGLWVYGDNTPEFDDVRVYDLKE